MEFTTLISPSELMGHLQDENWAILDTRFTLGDPERGQMDYYRAHIPHAIYVHPEKDMSGPIIPGKTGRHPLLPLEDTTNLFSRLGIDQDVQVVIYDDWNAAAGAVAARLWWMLRWLGHTRVAVLDGGWNAWLAHNYPTTPEITTRQPRQFTPQLHLEIYASMADTKAALLYPSWQVVDSRTADRYRGENETIDPIAGRIPGALNLPYLENCLPDGRFKPKEEIRSQFKRVLGDTPASKTIFYCGSGLTSALNVLAMVYAGLGNARLYVGSWSEWITDPNNPIDRG
ncbi:MAG: sulfurtransferase [Anaerolineales bacterium]